MKKIDIKTWRKIFSELPNLSVSITYHKKDGEVIPMFFISSAGQGNPQKSVLLPIFEAFAGSEFGYHAVMVQHKTPYILFYGEAVPLWECLDNVLLYPDDASQKYREDYICLLKNLALSGNQAASKMYDEFIDNETIN